MKFIHSDSPKHAAINLEKVIKFVRYEYNGRPAVQFFEVRGNSITWYFENQEKREEAMENIQSVASSQNISTMVKFE